MNDATKRAVTQRAAERFDEGRTDALIAICPDLPWDGLEAATPWLRDITTSSLSEILGMFFHCQCPAGFAVLCEHLQADAHKLNDNELHCLAIMMHIAINRGIKPPHPPYKQYSQSKTEADNDPR
jgi:hypothetical protein